MRLADHGESLFRAGHAQHLCGKQLGGTLRHVRWRCEDAVHRAGLKDVVKRCGLHLQAPAFRVRFFHVNDADVSRVPPGVRTVVAVDSDEVAHVHHGIRCVDMYTCNVPQHQLVPVAAAQNAHAEISELYHMLSQVEFRLREQETAVLEERVRLDQQGSRASREQEGEQQESRGSPVSMRSCGHGCLQCLSCVN